MQDDFAAGMVRSVQLAIDVLETVGWLREGKRWA